MKEVILCLFAVIHFFAGSAQDNSEIRIAFLTDIHVNPGADTEKNLVNIVSEINAGPFYDFVVITGDLTNTGSDAELYAVHSALSMLKIPHYAIPGNHETNWSESAGQTFIKLWGNDRFHFKKGKYRFVGFSTGPYMKMGDGHVREEDVQWLQTILKEDDFSGDPVISLSHYPLSEGLDNWHIITDILKKNNTKLALCGHGHRLSYHNFGGIPGIMGRSSLPKGYEKPGYNVLVIRNDSALVYEKKLGMDNPVHYVSIYLDSPDLSSAKTPSPLPDFTINDQFSAFINSKLFFNLQDSSAIHTGIVPASANHIVYANSRGQVRSVNIKSKKITWEKHLNGSIYGTPVSSGNLVIAGTIDGHIYGINRKNGKEKWKLNTGEVIIADGIINDGMLYIGAGNNSFYKIDIMTGKIIWKNNSMDGQMQGKPVITNNEILFGAWDRHLYCLDKKTGALKWKWNNGSPQKLYSPGNVAPVVANGKVFIVAPDRYMTAIDLQTGKTVWRDNSRTVRESMGISENGKSVYAKIMNDTIIAVSTESDRFSILWETNADFGYEHNPCPVIEANGVVYAGTKNGVLIAIDSKTHQVLWKHKAGNSSLNRIVADRKGRIWISLIEGKILAYKN